MNPKDLVVEIPQTVIWYQRIRVALGKSSAYSVEKMVEPEAFRRRRGCYSHNNKWTHYAEGRHLPQKRIRELAERVNLGSSAVLENPIWKVAGLSWEMCIADFADDWLWQLGPDFRHLFFRLDPVSNQYIRRSISARKLCLLRARADLDALAALSILLREAAEKRRYKLTMQIADVLYRTLFHCVMSEDEALRIALPKIFEMLVKRIFCFARDRHFWWCFDGIDFLAFFKVIQHICCEASEFGCLDAKRVDSMIDVCFRSKQLGLVFVYPPLRPISAKGVFAQDEENFHDRINSWQSNAEQLTQKVEM